MEGVTIFYDILKGARVGVIFNLEQKVDLRRSSRIEKNFGKNASFVIANEQLIVKINLSSVLPFSTSTNHSLD